MNQHSLGKIWVIISLLAALGLILGVVNPVLAQDGDWEPLAKTNQRGGYLASLRTDDRGYLRPPYSVQPSGDGEPARFTTIRNQPQPAKIGKA